MSESASDRSGESFGHYRLDALLGRGGMGEVYRAHDTVRDREIAIKLVHAQLAEDQTFQERFRRECQTLARLGEPHIIPIHDFGEIDGHLFLDMRLVDGRDLRAILSDRGTLDAVEAVELIEQVASALTAAHRADLVHRDVKPENVLVTEDGFAYLVDFGVAHATDETRLTRTGTAVGSVAYMSPEQFENTPITSVSDVYSLSALLYEMLTEKTPYTGDSISTVMRGVLFGDIPVASESNNAISPAMDAVIAWGLTKSPDDRCPSAKELAAAARAALAGEFPPSGEVDKTTTTVPTSNSLETAVAPVISMTKAPSIPAAATPDPAAVAPTMTAPSAPALVRSTVSGPHFVNPAPQVYPPPGYVNPVPPMPAPPTNRGSNALLVVLGLMAAALLGAGAWLAMEQFGGSEIETPTPVADQQATTVVQQAPGATTTVTTAPAYSPGSGTPPSDSQPCPGYPGVGTGYPQWTGCAFAANVRDAYVSSGQMGASRTVNGWAPQQRLNYAMACAPYAGIVACRGGNQAVVYIY